MRKTKNLKHPHQPVGIANDGRVRFKANAIVDWMLEQGSTGERFDLNTIARLDFPREDYVQLMQLIGYSVSGFGELSCATPKVYREATKDVPARFK